MGTAARGEHTVVLLRQNRYRSEPVSLLRSRSAADTPRTSDEFTVIAGQITVADMGRGSWRATREEYHESLCENEAATAHPDTSRGVSILGPPDGESSTSERHECQLTKIKIPTTLPASSFSGADPCSNPPHSGAGGAAKHPAGGRGA